MPTFSPAFLDELRARTPLAGLIGRRTRLARSGRQWKGCCPFHGEKTPSFYVYDDHFHCFGCGAHGDAVSFVMQMDGLGFPETVAALAGEAGLALPEPDRAEQHQRAREIGLHEVLEAASRHFEALLRGAPDAAPARAYLAGRGVGANAIDRFRLGWSGGGETLRPVMARAGYEAPLLLEAGLLHAGEDGAIRGEMFRNRITFPISDRRGRVAGFGARALADVQPKYLNGPETAVFSKRRMLYGQDLARGRLRRAPGPAPAPAFVLAEGYLDVIALDEAGFAAAAPLGTALGEEQLAEAWSIDPTPVLCLDGDAAGRRAARRAIERALPLLTSDKTIRVAFLADGEDPDNLLRTHGRDALAGCIAAAVPLADALYALLEPPGEGGIPEGRAAGSSGGRASGAIDGRASGAIDGRASGATPEARAAFRGRLEAAAATIADRTLAGEYRRVLLDRYYEATRRAPRGGPGRDGRGKPAAARAARPVLSEEAARAEQAAQLALIAAHNPSLIHDVEEAWARLALPAWLAALRDAVIDAAGLLDSEAVMNQLRHSGKEHLLARATELVRRTGGLGESARAGAMPAAAEAGWWHFFGLIQHAKLDDEIRLATSLLEQDFTDGRQLRLIALVEARAKNLLLEHDEL